MHSTRIPVVTPVIKVSNSTERKYVRTPQRKAKYADKTRLRLKDLKEIAFHYYKVKTASQIKAYLKRLRVKLDLRLTAAWDAVVFELRALILDLIAQDNNKTGNTSKFKPGDRVIWDYPVGWGYYEQWFPLTVREVCGDMVYLDYKESPVSISTLTLAA